MLSDGTSTYLYGNGRIAQMAGVDSAYFLGDALGSVRQLTDASGAVTLTKSYGPYGEIMVSTGIGVSAYGYTGEWNSSTNLLYLRARFYNNSIGRFMTRDTWQGADNLPASFNKWVYGLGNPVNRTDPSGLYSIWPELSDYFVSVDDDWPAGHRQELISAVSDVGSRLLRAYNNDHLAWIWANYDEYKGCEIEAMKYEDNEAGKVFSQVFRTTNSNPLLIEWDLQCDDCKPDVCDDPNYANDPANQSQCTPGGGFTHHSHYIEFASLSEPGGNRTTDMAFISARNNIVHELGHAFASRLIRYTSGPRTVLGRNDYLYLRDEQGFHPSPQSARLTWRQHPGDVSPSEIFADMFLGWTYDTWADDIFGKERADFMSLNMHHWISMAKYW